MSQSVNVSTQRIKKTFTIPRESMDRGAFRQNAYLKGNV